MEVAARLPRRLRRYVSAFVRRPPLCWEEALRWPGPCLLIACRTRNAAVARAALAGTTEEERTDGLREAARRDDVGLVRLLLPRVGAKAKRRALQVAAHCDSPDVVRLLLAETREEVDEQTRFFALRRAARSHPRVIRVFFETGVEPEVSLLSFALHHGYIALIRELIAAGVDVRWNDDHALRAAARHPEAVRILLEAGADARTSRALSAAAAWGCAETVRVLLAHGADVGERDGAPLCSAAAAGKVDTASVLLEHGAGDDVHALDEALYRAAASYRTEMVRLLLAHGAEARARDSAALGAALSSNLRPRRPEVARLLLEAGADPQEGRDAALLLAVSAGDADTVRDLLAQGADPRSKRSAALSIALAGRKLGLTRTLIEAGASFAEADDFALRLVQRVAEERERRGWHLPRRDAPHSE